MKTEGFADHYPGRGIMPTLIRLVIVLLFLAGLGYGAMFALTVFVEPREKDVVVRVPAQDIFDEQAG